MFSTLKELNLKPKPFSKLTTSVLWCDPYISQQMLNFHLNDSTPLASRPTEFRKKAVNWIGQRFNITKGFKLLELGCGPGLYSKEFASLSTDITAVDFSSNSIAYAKKQAEFDGLKINYLIHDYLELNLDNKFDLVSLIYLDYCALSPSQRKKLLTIIKQHLKPGGHFILDVVSQNYFYNVTEKAGYELEGQNGFWSKDEAYIFHNCFKYESEFVTLDKFSIFESNRSWEVYNWMQSFTLESLKAELSEFGLMFTDQIGDLTGAVYDQKSEQFALIAQNK